MDLETLIQPIDGDNRAGTSQRLEPVYTKIRAMRKEALGAPRDAPCRGVTGYDTGEATCRATKPRAARGGVARRSAERSDAPRRATPSRAAPRVALHNVVTRRRMS